MGAAGSPHIPPLPLRQIFSTSERHRLAGSRCTKGSKEGDGQGGASKVKRRVGWDG